MELVTEKVKTCLGEVLKLSEVSHITPSTQLSYDLNLDSSLFIELLMTLEDHFTGLMFDPENLRREDFATVQALSNYIAQVWQPPKGADGVNAC